MLETHGKITIKNKKIISRLYYIHDYVKMLTETPVKYVKRFATLTCRHARIKMNFHRAHVAKSFKLCHTKMEDAFSIDLIMMP